MLTLGVDLSALQRKTAACLLDWRDGTATIAEMFLAPDREQLVRLITETQWVGIDAPFGWPREFLLAVNSWASQGQWPAAERVNLRYRMTDRWVAGLVRHPLSVSSDRIAVTAMVCAELLTEVGERRLGPGGRIDRSGDDGIVEVYPGAALVCWSDSSEEMALDPQGYKGSTGSERRETLIAGLMAAAPWLDIGVKTQSLLHRNDDALDALLCSLVARAAAQGLTTAPPDMAHTEAAHHEGWIHLPEPGTLSELP